MICKACSLTLSSSDRCRCPIDCGLASLVVAFALVGDRADVSVLTTGSSTPWLTHVSFFWWCPTISFLRARSAADCSGHVLALRSCVKIGEVWGRAMEMGVPDTQAVLGVGGIAGEAEGSVLGSCPVD